MKYDRLELWMEMTIVYIVVLVLTVFLLGFIGLFTANKACAHDIYTGVRGKQGQICCGGNDCSPTIWREQSGKYQFLTREGDWVEIPEDRIIFLPIPGDEPGGETHRAHLCYRPAHDNDWTMRENVFGKIFLYCAFVTPGGM